MHIYISCATTILYFIENLQAVWEELRLPDLMDRPTDTQGDSFRPPNFVCCGEGIISSVCLNCASICESRKYRWGPNILKEKPGNCLHFDIKQLLSFRTLLAEQVEIHSLISNAGICKFQAIKFCNRCVYKSKTNRSFYFSNSNLY